MSVSVTVPPHTDYVAAFRAYLWNDDIAALAARFFEHCPGARHVVLLNEEHGPIDVGPYEKVSHGRDFSEFGLPERPVGRSPWYNADYTYCLLRFRLPGYAYYLIVESDVAVNTSMGPLIEHAVRENLDALVHQVSGVHPDWVHYEASLAQPDPLRCFLFACLFSGRALETLVAARQLLARQPDAADRPWPICESFIPSALRDAGMRMGEIAPLVDTEFLRYRPFLSLLDPRATRPGSIAHPVLGAADLARSLLYDQPPRDLFRPGTVLHEALDGPSLGPAAPALIEAFARSEDHAGVALLHARLRERGLPFPHRADLAYAKPALISSVSPWSRGGDPGLDACGANGAILHGDNAFHTDGQVDAWWQVDLLEDCVVDRVEIVNRLTFADRFHRFVVESSRDGGHWAVRHLKHDDAPVSSEIDTPWSVTLPEPFLARFVRIRRLGPEGCLHLRRVRVFGRGLRDPGV